MIIAVYSKISKAMLVLGLIAFLMIGFFGMSRSTMNMGPDGSMTMSHCPFMSDQAVACNMNLLEHIAVWQSMFTTTLRQHGSDVFALLLAALALMLVWEKLLQPRCKQKPKLAFFTSARREQYLPLPLLQELFSNGILNPKIF